MLERSPEPLGSGRVCAKTPAAPAATKAPTLIEASHP
jgi:hypothetical protein